MTYTSLEFSGAISPDPAATISVANNGSLAFGTGDFTIEMYVYRKNTVDPDGNGDIRLCQMGNWPSGKLSLVWGVYPKSSTNVSFYHDNADFTGYVVTSGITSITNTWVHLALCRASGIIRLFIDGVQSGSDIADTSNYSDTTTALTIGAQPNELDNTRFEGYMTGIRISNNARYTANFDKPDGYLEDSNTLLILNGSSSNSYGSLSSGVTLNNMTTNSSIPSGWTEITMPYEINNDNTDNQGIIYTLDSPSTGQATVSGKTSSLSTNLVIPDQVSKNGTTYDVVKIGDNVFESSYDVTSVTMRKNVTYIGNRAFADCRNMVTINMGVNVEYISAAAFDYCLKLTSVTIPESVTYIGTYAFIWGANIQSVYFLGDNTNNRYFSNDSFNFRKALVGDNGEWDSWYSSYPWWNPDTKCPTAIAYYLDGKNGWSQYISPNSPPTQFSSIQSFKQYNRSTTYQSGDSVAILNETTIASVPSGVTMNIEADATITSAISGSILNITSGKTATISSGTTTVTGSGNLILNANNTNATTVQIGTTTFTGDITVSGDSTNIVKYTGNSTLTLSGNIVKDGTTLTLDASNGSIEVSGVISGVTAGSSDIIISGDVTFSNPENPYDGPTTIHSGATLTLNESSIPNSDVTIENGGTLIIINSTMPSSVNVKSITMSTGAILDVTDGYLKVDTLNITGGTIKTYAAGSTTILCSNAATVSNTIQVDLYGSVSTGTSYFVINAASGLSGATYNVTYYGDTQNVDLNAISSSMLLYLQVAELQGFLFPAYLNLSNPITTATTYIEVTDCAGLHLGTGDFEIEWTQYQYWYDNPGNMRVFSINSWPTAVISVSIEYYQGSPRFFYWNNQGTSFNNIAAIDPTDLINQWNTFKVNRTSGVTKFYRNGVQIGSNLTDTQNITGSASLIIGGDGNRSCPFTGWISSFRWTKGSPATNTFTINDSQESGDMISNIYYHTPSGTTQTYIPLTLQTPYPSCFNEGTMILCEVDGEEKYMPIEKLARGDKVVSYLHGALPILAIGKGYMVNDPSEPKRCMYKLPKTGNMTDDLMITGGHALLVDERPKGLCFKIDDKFLSFAESDKRCVKMENTDRYTYYNLCLENNGNKDQRFGVWANGMLCETPSEKQFNDHQYSELL
jgi:BspA type Leucine rich repeat region (6 copies)/Concanavalin A-like lectin/glucanases superfamily/Hint domain